MPNGLTPACDLFAAQDRSKSWVYDESLAVFERLNIPVVNLRQQYLDLGSPKDYYYFSGSHFTEKGYAWLSKSILEAAHR